MKALPLPRHHGTVEPRAEVEVRSAMGRTVADVVTVVSEHVDYLHASTEAPPDEGWVRSDELALGGEPLVGLLRRTGIERGAHALDVAASLFAMSYAFLIGAVPLAAHALGLPVPDVRPEMTAISVAPGRPVTVALLAPQAEVRDEPELARVLLAENYAPLVDAIRREVTVGERLLWGNAASSFARVYRAVEGADGVDRAEVRRRAEAFFAAARPWFEGLGRFETATVGSGDEWIWTRSSCCLWYRASGGAMCDDCSLDAVDA